MSSIGAYTFYQMTGEKLQPLSPGVETVVRPGTSGEIYREEPARARVFEAQTVELTANIFVAHLRVNGYPALKLTLVTVIDDTGLSTANVLVVDVQNIQVQYLATPSDSGLYCRVTARWILKPTV
jgi:hypothetical protein